MFVFLVVMIIWDLLSEGGLKHASEGNYGLWMVAVLCH
jgi:hypothetical protein